MHPSILTPQSLRMASAMPVTFAMALRSARTCAPAAGVCIAGVSYREAALRKRGPAIAGVRAGSAGTRHSLNFTPPILTPEESRVNT